MRLIRRTTFWITLVGLVLLSACQQETPTPPATKADTLSVAEIDTSALSEADTLVSETAPPASETESLDWFSFAEPTADQQSEELALWGTYYKVHQANTAQEGFSLLGEDNEPLSPVLSERDWCDAALEGTVAIETEGKMSVYNYMDHNGPEQGDCAQYYSSLKPNVLSAMRKTRFVVSSAPYGYGVNNWYLVPFRTLAVDRNVIPYGSVVYIPQARGVDVLLPSGKRVEHDGYFYAGDTGGAIKKKHVDFFGGFYSDNPFPEIIKSNEESTFQAFILLNAEAQAILDSLHQR